MSNNPRRQKVTRKISTKRMNIAGLGNIVETEEYGSGAYDFMDDNLNGRGKASKGKRKDSKRKKKKKKQKKVPIDNLLRSSVVSSIFSDRYSVMDKDDSVYIPIDEEEESHFGNQTKKKGRKKESKRKAPSGKEKQERLNQLYALRDVVGSVAHDGYIDRATFVSTFEIEDEDDCDFDDYEQTTDGKIDVNALLVNACYNAGMEEKDQLKFIFELFDTNKNGAISRQQVAALLQASLSQTKLDVVGMNFDSLAKILFRRLKKDENDTISFKEFASVFKNYVSEAFQHKDKSMGEQVGQSKAKIVEYYEQNQQVIWWLVVYALLNIGAFISKYTKYDFDPAVGMGLRIARGFAQVIMLNFVCVLLPMCRSIIGALKKNKFLWTYIPFDDNIEFHKLAGITLLTSALIHTGAHVSNEYHLYLVATPEEFKASRFAQIPGFEDGLPSIWYTLQSLPIWTGICLFLITIIAFPLAALPGFRKNRFNWFWYSHMLFGPFLVLGAIHGSLSWLATSQSYMWIIPPFSIYLLERRFRYAKLFTTPVRIMKAELMDGTLGLFMEKPKRFVYRPGMYMFLNCPSLSRHEWHPFTISSAPGDEFVSVHIRNAGDWTNAIHQLIENCQKNNVSYPDVYIDGPVGAPTQDYQRYKTIMMIGGGIGVTPFASIMKDTIHLWNDYRCQECQHIRHPQNFQIQKMYFHWVTRGQDSLRWFENTMNQVAEMDKDDIIESHHYLTSVKNQDQNLPLKMFQAFVHDETGKDFVSGLKTKQVTHFGRPDWDRNFKHMVAQHPGETIGVFFCGPHVLDRILGEACAKYSSEPETGGTYFDYHSEKFS